MSGAPAVTFSSGEIRLGTCAVCGHALSRHDQIATRFCEATQTRAITRDCICRSDD